MLKINVVKDLTMLTKDTSKALALWGQRAQKALDALNRKAKTRLEPTSLRWISGQVCQVIVHGGLCTGTIDVFANGWDARVNIWDGGDNVPFSGLFRGVK